MGSDEHGPAYPEPRYCSNTRCLLSDIPDVWCMRDDCPRRNPMEHIPENVAGFHRRIAARHEKYAPYACPICGGGKNRYLTCDYPGCPDGHDQPFDRSGPDWAAKKQKPAVRCAPCLLITTLLALALVGALLFACIRPAAAFDHGFDKTTERSKWFAGLKVPPAADEPDLSAETKQWFGELKRHDKMPDSCCGEADAYEADTFVKNKPTTLEPWGSYDVTVTNGEDPHPWPDGTHRTPIKNGTVVHVPGNRINPPAETKNNPTGHSWLFVSTKRDMDGSIAPDHSYCYAPLPEGS